MLCSRLLCVCLALFQSGCLATRVRWREPKSVRARPPVLEHFCSPSSQARQLYDEALRHEHACEDACVDLFFSAAVEAGQACRCTNESCPARLLHQSALKKLVVSGQDFRRFDPRTGLVVYWQGVRRTIPVEHYGFVWKDNEFDRLAPVGDYRTNAIRSFHRCGGAGIPLVVTTPNRSGDPFRPKKQNFAATLCLRAQQVESLEQDGAVDHVPYAEAGSAAAINSTPIAAGAPFALELYDPLRVDRRVGCAEPIAKDLSAPLVFGLKGQSRTILADFINPIGNESESRLYFLEPYQSRKIPLVLIHGLLSDPFTWVEMVNELRAQPGFIQRYQIWVYEYPTGRSFFASGAALRKQLNRARELYDPNRQDPYFSNMVLVGHSMGGLIAKLQITTSGDALWRAAANQPFENVYIPPFVRETIRESFFFEASPDIARVVFIGTPHQGSAFARRSIGRFASVLVKLPEEYRQAYQQLIACNPGVFSPETERRIPTSLDLLEPNSELLQAVSRLNIDPQRVQMHSVIGDGCVTLQLGRSDSIVPVESAREYRAQSEFFVPTTHGRLHKDSGVIQEVQRILREHLQSLPACE